MYLDFQRNKEYKFFIKRKIETPYLFFMFYILISDVLEYFKVIIILVSSISDRMYS